MNVQDVLAQFPVLRPGAGRVSFVLTDEDKRKAIEEDLHE